MIPRLLRGCAIPLSPVTLAILMAAPATAQTPDAALEHARALLRSTPLIDGHNDLPWAIRTAERAPRDVP